MNFFRVRCRPLCFVLAALTFSVTSCTNIQNDGTRTRTEGALAGAVLGAGLGAIIGNQSGSAGQGALLGAALGGLGGLAYGNHVANKKSRYASEEAWLNACISQAQQANSSARSYNSRLSSRISALKQQIAAANASGNSYQKSQAKKAIIQLQRESNAELNKVDSEIKAQQGVLGQTNNSRASSLRGEVSSLQSTRSSMRSNIDRLASLGNSVDA